MLSPFFYEAFNTSAGEANTRFIVFAAGLPDGTTPSEVAAECVDGQGRAYALSIESLGVLPIPSLEAVHFLVIKSSELGEDVGDILLNIKYQARRSNAVLVGIGHVGDGPLDDGGDVGRDQQTQTLFNDFDAASPDAGKWSVGSPDGAFDSGMVKVNQTDGRLHIAPASNTGRHYGGYFSRETYNLTGGSVTAEFFDLLNPDERVSAGLSLDVTLKDQATEKILFSVSGKLLSFTISGAGGDRQTCPYIGAEHRWLRIRHDSATDSILGEASPDRTKWLTLFAAPRNLPLNAVRVGLYAGTDDLVVEPGIASFDNFALAKEIGPSPDQTPSPTPVAPPTETPTMTAGTVTPTVTPTLTLTQTNSPSPARTRTPTPTGTRVPTQSPTFSPTRSSTPTPAPTSTPTRTRTPLPTAAPTLTFTNSPVRTATPTPRPTSTSTPAPTRTPTLTPSPRPTPAPTATPTPSPTQTPTRTVVVSSGTIQLDPNVRYQTMTGWEATAQSGQDYISANYRDQLASLADDLGINRLRVEIVRNAMNSNGTIEFTGTDSIDSQMDKVFMPLAAKLQARGEKLFLNVCFVNFRGDKTLRDSPTLYAQFVLKTYQHLQQKYGLVPDAWEVILEPDTDMAAWGPVEIGRAVKAAGDLLKANGFEPSFIAPSTTAASRFNYYLDGMGALSPYVKELSYHRYDDPSDSVLQSIAARGRREGLPTAMLEWIGADYAALHRDLKQANVSSWQQYVLAGLKSWDSDVKGEAYFVVDDATGKLTVSGRTKFLRQYFKYVRTGAVRIGATTKNNAFDPVAFINSNGKYVVVINCGAPGVDFTIGGLPSGNYGVRFTSNSQYDGSLTDVSISAGQALSTSMPGRGVITIYGK